MEVTQKTKQQSPWVLVTGCSSGIGLCAAVTLHQRGYQVIATVRSPEDKASLVEAGIQNIIFLELNDSESINQAVKECLILSNNQLFAVFNNAAYGQPGAVEDLSRETLRLQFETNVFGTHELTTKLLPCMLENGEGRIVQNSSILGFVAMPMRGAYNASKFALEGLSDTLRLELAGSGVHVSLIEPGPITSKFRENALAALEQNVDFTQSRHQEKYRAAVKRLKTVGPSSSFTLPASAVVKKLILALEAKRPKARYRVTTPTHLFAALGPFIPNRMLDKIVLAVSKSE